MLVLLFNIIVAIANASGEIEKKKDGLAEGTELLASLRYDNKQEEKER